MTRPASNRREILAGIDSAHMVSMSTPTDENPEETFNLTTTMRPVSDASLDAIDVSAGVAMAASMGYGSPTEVMAIEMALNEWARGEESRAMVTMRDFAGVDLTSAYAIIAAARASTSAVVRGTGA